MKKPKLLTIKSGVAPELDLNLGCLIKRPKNIPEPAPSREELLYIARTLNEAYARVQKTLVDINDDLNEDLEEEVGTAITAFITKLAYYQDKNNLTDQY